VLLTQPVEDLTKNSFGGGLRGREKKLKNEKYEFDEKEQRGIISHKGGGGGGERFTKTRGVDGVEMGGCRTVRVRDRRNGHRG